MGDGTETLSRRRLLAGAGAAGLLLPASGALAAFREVTPRQPAGPFYVPFKPLSIDNDLAVLPGRTVRGDGQLIHLVGRVLDQTERPIAAARVEVWQANAYGRYNHPRHANSALKLDPNFQGFGHDRTDETGAYRFRTIKPGPYPDSPNWLRPPHIHFAVFTPKADPWTTQMYFPGEALNETDLLLNRVGDAVDRARLIAAVRPPAEDAEAGSVTLSFDIVLGQAGARRT